MHADHADLDGPADFDETFREHYWPMVRSLSVACGDREAAADAVQDAFTRAYARWRRISRYDHPAGWIRHVALNRSARPLPARGSGERRCTMRLAGQAADDRRPTRAPRRRARWPRCGGSPPQQQIAVSLFYVEQLSVREIAASMKLSEGAVKYHLHAGRHRVAASGSRRDERRPPLRPGRRRAAAALRRPGPARRRSRRGARPAMRPPLPARAAAAPGRVHRRGRAASRWSWSEPRSPSAVPEAATARCGSRRPRSPIGRCRAW